MQLVEQGWRQPPALLDFVGGGPDGGLDGFGARDDMAIAGQFFGSRNQHVQL